MLKTDSDTSLLSDNELVEQIVFSNDIALFEVLYERHEKKVFHKCMRFTRNKEEAKDMTQDIFIKIFVGLKTFKGDSKFTSWMYSLTRNYCINYKNRNSGGNAGTINAYDEKLFNSKRVLKETEWPLLEMKWEKVKKVLDDIDPELYSFLMARYKEGYSFQQLGDLYHISEGAAKMRLYRAKLKVVDIFNDMND